jgi:redox-sensitive bicupin YhaK (pirin superfamily)
MITVRYSAERGHFNHGWLETYHTFSFADYQDAAQMGFRSLRVINEDRVAPGQGFGRHPHRDMEILTYVLSGELEHRDSMGNHGRIRPGEVQYMAAGTGVEHSEFNPSPTDPVHLMQIWIRPDRKGAAPRYEQRRFPSLSNSGELTLLASRDGRGGSIHINQDALLYAAAPLADTALKHELRAGRGAWIQVLHGHLEVAGERLNVGDGAALSELSTVTIRAVEGDSEFLLFDLA